MREPAIIPITLLIPAGLDADVPASDVASALDALREGLTIPGRVVVTVESSDLGPQLVVNGWRLPTSELADLAVSLDPELAARYRWGRLGHHPRVPVAWSLGHGPWRF